MSHDTHVEAPSTRGDAGRYDQLVRLAAGLERAAGELRARALLGVRVLRDPDVADSAGLSPTTWRHAEDDVRAATTGSEGLLDRAVECDADAVALRATVATYRRNDDLQTAALGTLGGIAERAAGYVPPGLALGGPVVAAGLIETDALDRDEVAAYLAELAAAHAELLDHVATGGGLLDGLRARALLTASALGATDVAATGPAALGVEPFAADPAAALCDAAVGLREEPSPAPALPAGETPAPEGLAGLLDALAEAEPAVEVGRVGPGRYLVLLPGSGRRHGTAGGSAGRLRLVAGDHSSYAARARAAVLEATAGDEGARVMLAGAGAGAVAAAELAAGELLGLAQVVLVGAPAAPAARIAAPVLSLVDRTDPVAVLAGVVGGPVDGHPVDGSPAAEGDRLTVVVDGPHPGPALDRACASGRHPDLTAAVDRMRRLGFLR